MAWSLGHWSLFKVQQNHLLGGRRLFWGAVFWPHRKLPPLTLQPSSLPVPTWQLAVHLQRSPETWVYQTSLGLKSRKNTCGHGWHPPKKRTTKRPSPSGPEEVGRGSIFNPRDVDRTELCDPLWLALAARSNGLRPFDVLSLTDSSLHEDPADFYCNRIETMPIST